MLIENEHGYIAFDFKHDLNDEEGDQYLPDFYQGHVIELSMIKANHKGGGHALMQAFLRSASVQHARLVFLDCCPLFQEGDESQIMQRLHDFFAQYGFVGKADHGYSRLWRIHALPPSYEECFAKGYNPHNDLHPVLMGRSMG